MRVSIFSKQKQMALKNSTRNAGAEFCVDVFPLDALTRTLPTLSRGSLVYLDLGGISSREQAKRLQVINDHPEFFFGIIDFKAEVEDPASLFRHGVVDYLGKPFSKAGLTARRVSEVITFARMARGGGADLAGEEGTPAPGLGWDQIFEGREYGFYFLFIEVDHAEEMKKRYGADNLARAMETFRAFVERGILPYGGKLWMWSGFGGIALFPMSSQDYAPLVCAFRMLLRRPFYDVEESPLPNYLSFRMSLSMGTMTYMKKKTGGIISDALNSIFHIGQRFTEAGTFTLTSDIVHVAPDGLKDYIMPAGVFEGRKIFKARAPLYPSSQREGNERGDGRSH
jgi:CheY-like chemotaxis protein